jgi:hypothetical protein
MLQILKHLLSLASFISKQIERKQLMEAGADKVIKNNLYESLEKIKSSQAALRRARADKSIIKRLRDKYGRK